MDTPVKYRGDTGNVTRLHLALDDLTLDESRAARNHLLGGVSDYIDPTTWDRRVAEAVAFATRNRVSS